MKPLQELLKGKVVNCQTEEEAKEFLSFMHENGYKWISGQSLKDKSCYYRDECTCYNTNNYPMNVAFADKSYYKRETRYQIITYQQFKQLIKENNIETKKVKTQVPEGYEIDKENSTFDDIKFKPIKKVVNYEDVIHKLNDDAIGVYTSLPRTFITSSKQSEKLLAINKLMNVAKYLNGGDFTPDFTNSSKRKWTLFIDKQNEIRVDFWCDYTISFVYFKSEELAKQAIEILGEETIKLAFSTDW